jgi:hypothetical protein
MVAIRIALRANRSPVPVLLPIWQGDSPRFNRRPVDIHRLNPRSVGKSIVNYMPSIRAYAEVAWA